MPANKIILDLLDKKARCHNCNYSTGGRYDPENVFTAPKCTNPEVNASDTRKPGYRGIILNVYDMVCIHWDGDATKTVHDYYLSKCSC